MWTSAKRLLYRAGFRVYKRRIFEDNTVFDTPRLTLRKARDAAAATGGGRQGDPDVQGQAGRAASTRAGKSWRWRSPTRRRMRTIVGAARVSSRYSAIRNTAPSTSSPARAGVATLDETPIGVYLELEGQPGWIDRTARRLGYARERTTSRAATAGCTSIGASGIACKPTNMVW